MLPDHLENLYSVLDKTGHPCMPLDMLNGYLCAVICSPEMIPPSQWMPKVFFDENMPEFSSTEEAQTVFKTLLDNYNFIISSVNTDDFGVVVVDGPVKILRESLERWCEGFIAGVSFYFERWTEELEDEALFVLLMMFEITSNFIDNQKIKKKKIPPFIRTKKQIDDFFDKINIFVSDMYLERLEQFKGKHKLVSQRKSDKFVWGRNEPCPCGSGKKFKKCCGSAV